MKQDALEVLRLVTAVYKEDIHVIRLSFRNLIVASVDNNLQSNYL